MYPEPEPIRLWRRVTGFTFKILYPEPESNRHGHCWPLDFKSSASTYSAIRAYADSFPIREISNPFRALFCSGMAEQAPPHPGSSLKWSTGPWLTALLKLVKLSIKIGCLFRSHETAYFMSGAGNGTRTRDPDLGKVVLYQLSYSRKRIANIAPKNQSCKQPGWYFYGFSPANF